MRKREKKENQREKDQRDREGESVQIPPLEHWERDYGKKYAGYLQCLRLLDQSYYNLATTGVLQLIHGPKFKGSNPDPGEKSYFKVVYLLIFCMYSMYHTWYFKDPLIFNDKRLLAPKYSGAASLEVLRPFLFLDPVLWSDQPFLNCI